MIEIEDLHKYFGDNHVLDGINLSVAAGEVICIIGPSGSGKSTLLRCINHLEVPERGRIRIDGELAYRDEVGGLFRPHANRAVAKVRAQVGMVFQLFNLFPHLTACENVMLGLRKVRGLGRAEARTVAEQWLVRVGLADKLESLPIEMSGGQQQRVGIARAVAMNPKVLLLDEITSALDPELVGEVLTVVRELAKDGMTMILVTHEMVFARDVSNHVVFMDDGRVAVEGPPREVFGSQTNERLRSFLARIEMKGA